MNALLDASVIQSLYKASQAGVKVELNVRGICALRPGVPGVSENIQVISNLGRFLEHSRIFSFERGGERDFYIGSADMMPRNLYNRVELLVPVADAALKDELADILDRSFDHNAGSWELEQSGDWRRREDGGERRDVQSELIERHTRLAKRPITAAAIGA